MKKCNICGKYKNETEFYSNKKTKDKLNCYCKQCQLNKYRNEHRISNYYAKKKLVGYYGNKCIKCGYDKCLAALEFHHRNKEDKRFGINYMIANKFPLEEIFIEAEKCELLCVNCHREKHQQCKVQGHIDDRNIIGASSNENMKKCSVCGMYKPLNDFNLLKTSKDGHHSRCKQCKTVLDIERRNNRINSLKLSIGGKCTKCGYDKCLAALEFHHRNKEDKLYNLSQKKYMKENSLLKEIGKCNLLCANCHREEHYFK